MNNPAIARWLGSAKAMPTSKQQKLMVQGQIFGVPPGSRVRGGLEVGTPSSLFTSVLDATGTFSGDISVDSVGQPMTLMFQLLDTSNRVIGQYRVVLN
jgi:hypothetical protein